MRRKFVCLLLAIMFVFSFTPIKARGNSLHLQGTISTKCSELALTEFMLGGDNIGEISGTITYDKTKMAVLRIDPTSKYSSWDFSFDYSNPGTIKVSGQAGENAGYINEEENIFIIMFVVHTTSPSTTNVVAKGFIGYSISELKKVTNQAEIDAATDQRNQVIANNEGKTPADPDYVDPNTIIIPEPIYSEEETIKNKTKVSFPSHTQTIKFEELKVSDSYLRTINIENSTFEPTFNKTAFIYKVTIDSKQELKIDCQAEDINAKVVVDDEVNNQVIIHVTAQDGTNSTYVLTIIRQDNYNSTKKDNTSGNKTNPTTPSQRNTPVLETDLFSTKNIIIYSGLAFIALIGFISGGIILHKGLNGKDE